ncbi:hypothetical protein HPULCUR_006411 [Helicostylum pulchrum]|uniref:Uncharacterized protein n=1 Tax=Helicostylum pulchrum TaxID=562976 RepID=A0ABP9Y1U7_9FUNG
MDAFRYLPLNILEYLEQEGYVTISPDFLESFQSDGTLQPQLTRNNWANAAQRNMYKRVVLNSIQQIESFVETLNNGSVGTLVRHIYFPLEAGEIEVRERTLFYIQNIAHFCASLESLRIGSNDYESIWELILNERINGKFTRLQIIPFVQTRTGANISVYYDVAFHLQETLNEIVIHDTNVPFDRTRPWHFPRMETVFFTFDDYVDAGSINRNMENFPTATCIEIDVQNRELSQVRVHTEFPIHVFPQVKKLSIIEHHHSTGLSSYIMKAFPKLQEVIMVAASMDSDQLGLSTKEAVQFLEYLVSVLEFNVCNIPISDQYGVMLGFYGRNRCINKLEVSYFGQVSVPGSQLLTLKTDPQVEGLIQIEIYHELGLMHFLPRIGLIEQSGENLQFLELCMNMDFGDIIPAVVNENRGVTLSRILRQCPQLRGISILHTALNDFGKDLRFKTKVKIDDYLSFTDSFFHTSFLSDLSFYVYYISHFTLKNCQFMNNTPESMQEINMPDTKFHTITCEYIMLVEKIYLKLIKTQTNVTHWYLIQGNHVFFSTEQDYKNSLQIQNILFLIIHCKNVFAVSIINSGHNSTINP